MRLAMIQSRQNKLYDFANHDLKFTKEEVAFLQKEMIDQNLKLMEEACREECDLIFTTEAINFCGPERALNCKYEDLIPTMDDELFKQFSKLSEKGKTYLAVGVFTKRFEAGKWNCYNSLVVYGPNGKLVTVYHKIHLAGDEKKSLTPGREYKTFDTPFGRVGGSICWDMQFPEVSRELALRNADLIICPTWGWEQIYGHARAYENGVYVASTMGVPYKENISGMRNPSEVVSPLGKVIASASRTKAGVTYCDFDPKDCSEYRSLRLGDRHPETYCLTGQN